MSIYCPTGVVSAVQFAAYTCSHIALRLLIFPQLWPSWRRLSFVQRHRLLCFLREKRYVPLCRSLSSIAPHDRSGADGVPRSEVVLRRSERADLWKWLRRTAKSRPRSAAHVRSFSEHHLLELYPHRSNHGSTDDSENFIPYLYAQLNSLQATRGHSTMINFSTSTVYWVLVRQLIRLSSRVDVGHKYAGSNSLRSYDPSMGIRTRKHA